MLKTLSYKRKNRLLLGTFIVVSFLAYQLSFSETLQTREKLNSIINQSALADGGLAKIRSLTLELEVLDQQIGGVKSREANTQEQLLEKLGNYCPANNLEIQEFPQPKVHIEDGYKVETGLVVLEGGYTNLLKLIHEIETNFHLGKLVSVSFESKVMPRSKKMKLYATIYIQKIQSV